MSDNYTRTFFAIICMMTLSLSGVSADHLPSEATILVPFGAVWRYHDQNVDLGTDWRMPDYDDQAWPEGPAILGYSTAPARTAQWPEPGLQTTMQENLVTYYLRHRFDYEGPLTGIELEIEQIIDDGAVYYLNGVEIARSALMPEGEIGFGTRATAFTNPWHDHEVLLIPNPPIRLGRNVLAVSLHNNAPGSSDICIGAQVRVVEKTRRPAALYLTWQRDPTTTMTIQWHTIGDTGPASLSYGPVDNGHRQEIAASTHPMPFSDRLIHTVELTGLQPAGEYKFQLHHVEPDLSSPVYRFRTMPTTNDQPVRMAIGGDVRHRQVWMEEMNAVAMRFDLDLIVWGGDLAYADGRADRLQNWEEFFDAMLNTLIDDSGRVVPVLFGIGNHEVVGGYFGGGGRGADAYEDTDAFRAAIAPYYYSLFAFPGHPGYGVLDFGDYLSIILLDTDHSGPIVGKQTQWLEEVLAARTDVPHVFPVYHVPAFPSHRAFDGGPSPRVRAHWVPLFERYGIHVAFEHHDHTYKRTVPIRDGRQSADGIIYIGDGTWGVGERIPREPHEDWYLEQTKAIRHAIIVSIQNGWRDIKVISREGRLIDHVMQP